MMNIKKRILMSLLVLSCCLSMIACFITRTVESRENQGGENAVDYIKDKYGIEAKVIESKLCEGGMFGEISNYADVKIAISSQKTTFRQLKKAQTLRFGLKLIRLL